MDRRWTCLSAISFRINWFNDSGVIVIGRDKTTVTWPAHGYQIWRKSVDNANNSNNDNQRGFKAPLVTLNIWLWRSLKVIVTDSIGSTLYLLWLHKWHTIILANCTVSEISGDICRNFEVVGLYALRLWRFDVDNDFEMRYTVCHVVLLLNTVWSITLRWVPMSRCHFVESLCSSLLLLQSPRWELTL